MCRLMTLLFLSNRGLSDPSRTRQAAISYIVGQMIIQRFENEE